MSRFESGQVINLKNKFSDEIVNLYHIKFILTTVKNQNSSKEGIS